MPPDDHLHSFGNAHDQTTGCQRAALGCHLLRLSFQIGAGDTPTLMLASFVRFCADGTLRGPDNYVVARCVDGMWQVGGRSHRELECEGPVRVRVSSRPGQVPVMLGPFHQLRTVNGVLHADAVSLHVHMPGRINGGSADCHEIAFLS